MGEAVKCVRIVRDSKPEHYRLPDDGRKWKLLCADRRALMMQLATFADGDGSRITVGTTRLYQALGWCRDKVFQRLDDLKSLGFLAGEGRTAGFGGRGTARRLLNLEALQKKMASPESVIDVAGVCDSASRSLRLRPPESVFESPESFIPPPESVPGADGTVTVPTHNPTPTTPTSVPGPRKPTKEAKTTVMSLLSLFVEKTGEIPKVTKAQKQELAELVMEFDPETVAFVFRAYLKAESWNSKTLYPLADFIANFESYLKKVLYDSRLKPGEKPSGDFARLVKKLRAALAFPLVWQKQFFEETGIPKEEQHIFCEQMWAPIRFLEDVPLRHWRLIAEIKKRYREWSHSPAMEEQFARELREEEEYAAQHPEEE